VLEKNLPTVTGDVIEIRSDDQDVLEHFNDPRNHVDDIIAQLTQEYRDLFNRRRYSTVLDIGANVGLFSLWLHSACDKIYALEPTPEHFALLEKLTKDIDNIEAVNTALADRDGDMDFFISRENSTMNTLVQEVNDTYDRRVRVPGLSINSLLHKLALDEVDLVKLDIEGGESLCVKTHLLWPVRRRIKSWFVECHGNPVGGSWQSVFESMKTVFQECGYVPYQVTRDGILAQHADLPPPRQIASGQYLTGDIVLPI
jgi:FkbM family methyltransferase